VITKSKKAEKTGKFEVAWKQLFEKFGIHEELEKHGQFHMSAKSIKSVGHEEPRLMCKWDTRDSRPQILKKITILPTSHNEYVLLKGDGYYDLPEPEPGAIKYYPPQKLVGFLTVDFKEQLRGEAAAIDAALLASILRTFTNEPNLALTIRGRAGANPFDFVFGHDSEPQFNLKVTDPQIEIDAGFEGQKIWLLEAKARSIKDFIIRQLYYPWRSLSTQILNKPIVPLFFTYVNRVFGLYECEFSTSKQYHSLHVVRQEWFTFDAPEALPSLETMFNEIKRHEPPIAVFPQADTLVNVVELLERCAIGLTSTEELATAMEFDMRQAQYYTAAAKWLEFLEPSLTRKITGPGWAIVNGDRTERFQLLFKAVVRTPVFYEAARARLAGKELTFEAVCDLVEQRKVNKTTIGRRAQTVEAWIKWLWQEYSRLQIEAS